MKNLGFSKLSPRKKLQKVLEYLFLIIVVPFVVLMELDFIFDDHLTPGIRSMCVWHGVNWFDWGFWILIVITIFYYVFRSVKQLFKKRNPDKKAKLDYQDGKLVFKIDDENQNQA